MSRVGLPVSPPFSRTITLEVVYKRFDGTIFNNFIPKSDTYAFLPVTKIAKQDLRFTLKFALDFKAAVADELSRLKSQKVSAEAANNIPAGLAKSIEKLEKFISEFDNWFFKNRTLQIPAENKLRTLLADVLSIILDAPGLNQLPNVFLINIITKPALAIEVEEPAISDDTASTPSVAKIVPVPESVEEIKTVGDKTLTETNINEIAVKNKVSEIGNNANQNV